MPRNRPARKPRPAPGRSTRGSARERSTRVSYPVVGIGASAGGLEAFSRLLSNLPVDTGMAFVLVQHLDPQHESALTGLLARATSMPVREITNNLRVEANHVYVIPPNVNMAIAQGVLKLSERGQKRAANRSIDFFFESLAADQRERAIGIILSGTASDGTLGLETIKAEGGITFAQDESARYDSMPRSAIAAGCVDFVLSPENIATELARIAEHPHVAGQLLTCAEPGRPRAADDGRREAPPPAGTRHRARRAESAFERILLLLRNHCGVDFSLYKPSTIQRRISRRMALNKQNTLDEYTAFLKGNTRELDALYSDALISVTSYFRNAEAFETLKRKVFPKLLQQRGRDDPLRVWVPGCSTGQETYSIAMCYAECSASVSGAPKLQIFATDLNDALLDKARHGLYAKTLVQDVSSERLRRFFVAEEGGYRVNKPLREQVVFARQDLLSDPPLSRMDLISCRNVLIYLEADLQKRIIPAFHYALKAGGFLFLGASESIGPFTELFEPADKKQKIFCKKPGPTPAFRLPMPKGRVASPAAARHPVFPIARAPDLPESLRTEADAQREADRLALNQFAPPGVLVDAELHVLQFRGATGMYLEPPTGRASFDVLKMAREGLAVPLRAALKKAERENKPVRTKNVRIQQNGGTRGLNLHVIPLKSLKERYYLVWFEPADGPRAGGTPASAPPAKPPASRPVPRQVADLKRELSETRAYLQSLQDQHAAAEEELQAFNEEVQSANEELQSINEELETSKEELESANEELITVNDELLNRNAELDRSNADLNNLQVSINTSILLLGRDLTVRRFTPAAGDLFALAAGDVGRPLGNIRHDLDLPDLEALVAEVIDTVSVREREVQTKDGRWYVLRARPYMTLDNKIDGAVLVLVDIDALKRTEREITVARDYAEAILRTTRYPLVVLREDLRVDTANAAFYKTFRVAPGQTEGRSIYELGSGQWNIPRLRELLEDILPRNSFFDDFEVTHDFESLGRRIMLLNARRLDTDEKDSPRRILLAIDDITEGKQLEDLRLSEMRYRRLFEAAKDGILVLDPHTQKITDANPVMMELLDFTREEVIGKELWEIGLLKDKPASHEAFRELRTTGGARYELPLQTKAGQRREVEVVANLYHEDGEQVIQCNIRDITERKHAVDELARHRLHLEELVAERTDSLKQSLERLRRSERLASIGTLAAGIAHEINNPLNSIVLMSECCLRGKGPVDPMEMLQKIKSEAVRGGRIVKNVLKFAKDERTSKSPADLNDVVRHATSLVSFYAQSAAVDIQVELAPDLPPVMMNPVEIELVLINLIKNAAEAGSARTHVVVRTAWDSQKVTLTVADDGSGMPQDIQAHIFDPFFTTKRGSGGSGLGLSLCHGIVSEHGGEISVHSQVGSGSTFTVELPAAQDGERTLEP